jgi:SAM-dependent methyltransferase
VVASDAADLPFRDGSFDTVVSINTFEHISRVEEALRECHRVLRPSGLAFLHLPPYYSPWGPHLENWIHFPWPHLLFSEKTLMRVAAREDTRRHLGQRFVEAARIDWTRGDEQVPDVNRVTLRRFRRMVSRAGFSILQFRLLPVGHEFLSSGSPLKQLSLSLLEAMARIPLLQEIVVTKMVYVLQKGDPG